MPSDVQRNNSPKPGDPCAYTSIWTTGQNGEPYTLCSPPVLSLFAWTRNGVRISQFIHHNKPKRENGQYETRVQSQIEHQREAYAIEEVVNATFGWNIGTKIIHLRSELPIHMKQVWIEFLELRLWLTNVGIMLEWKNKPLSTHLTQQINQSVGHIFKLVNLEDGWLIDTLPQIKSPLTTR